MESHWDMSERMTRSPGWEAVDDLDGVDGAAAELDLGADGVVAALGELEDTDSALLLAEGRAADVDDVVEALELDGAVDGEVGAGRPRGSSLVMVMSTRTVPFCTAGSMRATLPSTMPLRVSIWAIWPMAMSRAWVSAMRISALSLEGSATRAMLLPGWTWAPTSTGRLGVPRAERTPAIVARTCRASSSSWRRAASERRRSTSASWTASWGLMESLAKA